MITGDVLLATFGSPRLTVELIPRPCWFSSVRDQVDQSVWHSLRRPVFEQANYRCQICGGRGVRWPVECHEIWRYDDVAHVQHLDGLIALCPFCHEVKHIGYSAVRGRAKAAEVHLARVNSWTKVQLGQYLTLIWQLWRERNQYDWQVDFTWLQQFGVKIDSNQQGVIYGSK